MILPKRRQVRRDLVQLLRSAISDAEARHNLVEDQQRAFAAGNFTQEFQVARLRRNAAHVADDRFYNDAGNLSLEPVEGRFDSLGIVVGQRQGELHEFFRHAG